MRAAAMRRVPGRAAPIKTHLLVQRSLAEHEQPAQSRVQPRPSCAEDEGRDTIGMIGREYLRNGTAGRAMGRGHAAAHRSPGCPTRCTRFRLYFVGRLALARAHPAMIEGHDLEC